MTNNQLIYCIYHKNCLDGLGAAWVIDKYYNENKTYKPNVEFEGFHYGTEPDYDKLKDKLVYIVDFSFPKDTLEKIETIAHQLVLLDHHKTAKEDLESFVPKKDNTTILFDMERSGAKMTWDYFYPEQNNFKIDLIADRDLWQFNHEETKPFCAYMFFMGTKLNNFIEAMETPLEEAIKIGKILEEATEKRAKVASYNVRLIEFEGYKEVPIVNCPTDLTSLTGHILANQYECGFAITYSDTSDKRIYSMRSNGSVDVAELAKRHGGGGHVSAAGFSVPLEELNTFPIPQ